MTLDCARASRTQFTRAVRQRDEKIRVLGAEARKQQRTARKVTKQVQTLTAQLQDAHETNRNLQQQLHDLERAWYKLQQERGALQQEVQKAPTVRPRREYPELEQRVRLLTSQLSQRTRTVAELRDEIRRLKQQVRELRGATPKSDDFHQPRVFRGPRVTQRQSDALDQILAPAWAREQRKTGVIR